MKRATIKRRWEKKKQPLVDLKKFRAPKTTVVSCGKLWENTTRANRAACDFLNLGGCASHRGGSRNLRRRRQAECLGWWGWQGCSSPDY